jgi:hypothetical protein
MSSQFNSKALGKNERILALLLLIGFITGFLLTPLGFETRMSELRSYGFAAFFIITGLVLPAAALALLFFRPKAAAVVAVVDAALLFLTAPADQALFFFTTPPPPVVTAGEYLLIFVGIGYMLYAPRVYSKNWRATEP